MIAAQYITLSELQRRVRQVLEERFALPLMAMKQTICPEIILGAPVFVSGGSVFKTPDWCFSKIQEL